MPHSYFACVVTNYHHHLISDFTGKLNWINLKTFRNLQTAFYNYSNIKIKTNATINEVPFKDKNSEL